MKIFSSDHPVDRFLLNYEPVSSCRIRSGSDTFGGMRMESYQWFLLGIMVALTPSLLVLGVLLARTVDQPADTTDAGD